jgi:hypothetical protein
VAPALAIALAIFAWRRLPSVQLRPALVGLACWTAGNYLFCPLRWQSVSFAGRRLAWYVRVFAEGELLGLLTPQHAGADLWRVRQLTARGAGRSAAVLEIATDRLSGGLAVVVLAIIAGDQLPARALAAIGLAGAVLVLAIVAARRLWLPRLRSVPLPQPRRLARGAAVSVLYQAGYLGLLVGVVAAVGQNIDALQGASLLGLTQLAALLPGVHGAGPKEGAMTGALVAMGLPLTAALGAVALVAALTWVPALIVGGGGLAARSLHRDRATATYEVPTQDH